MDKKRITSFYKMIGKRPAVVLAIAMALVLVAPNYAKAENLTYGDWKYEVVKPEKSTDDDEIRITGYYGVNAKKLEIPEKIDGKYVTKLYGSMVRIDEATGGGLNVLFKDSYKTLESVKIPESVRVIELYAFSGCEKLTEIKLPNALTEIGDYAFLDCSGLTSITIPESVTSIGDSAFKKCAGLKEINLPKKLDRLGQYAFSGCKGLTEYTLSEGVKTIEGGTFYMCENLKKVVLPETMTSIPSAMFFGCSSLTDVTIPDGVTKIENSAFNRCGSLSDVELPKGLQEIGSQAFIFCTALTDLVIPKSVTAIGSYAFKGCENLVIHCYKDSTAHKYALENDIKFVLIDEESPEVPEDSSSVVIPAGTTEIENGAFFGRRDVKKVMIPDSVTSIGENAFAYSGVKSVKVPNGVKTIEKGAFCYSDIEKIQLSTGLKDIKDNAFWGCENLTSVTIPSGVKTIGDGAFSNCMGLKKVTIPDSVTNIGKGAFDNCPELVIYCSRGSAAETYAKKNKLPYKNTDVPVNISGCRVRFDAPQVYTGSAIKPTVTVTKGTKTLKNNTDYKVTYSNNINVGRATIKVTGKGDYTGTVTKTFRILPKGTTVTKLTAKKKAVTVTWTKRSEKMKKSRLTGYLIQYSTDKSFAKGNRSLVVKGYAGSSTTIKNLKSGKTYYVRIRTFIKVDGVNFFSKWSSAKTVKVK